VQDTKKHDTETHDTRMNNTKMQEKGNQKSRSGTFTHQTPVSPEVSSPVRGSRDTSKHVSEVKHESHKDEYRREHAKAGTGVKNASGGITGKTEPVANTPAAAIVK